MIYAYIREKEPDSYIKTIIEEINVDRENIYSDLPRHKENYKVMSLKLRANDLLYLHHISNLGGTYKEILDEWNTLNRRNIKIIVLKMPAINTYKDNIAEAISQMLVFVRKRALEGGRLYYLADREHAKAKRDKVKMQKEKLFTKAYTLYMQGMDADKAAMLCNLSRYRFLHKVRNKYLAEKNIDVEFEQPDIDYEKFSENISFDIAYRKYINGLSITKSASLCNMTSWEFKKLADDRRKKELLDTTSSNHIEENYYNGSYGNRRLYGVKDIVKRQYKQYKKGEITFLEACENCCLSEKGFKQMVKQVLGVELD